jgi:hypothetical protein
MPRERLGLFPSARMKQAMSEIRYIHSKMTLTMPPVVPRRSGSERERVRMRKTRKKLPYRC